MHRARLTLITLVLAAALTVAGCNPSVLCSLETQIFPDYTCTRVTRMEISPNQRFPGQQPRLGDFYQFPPAERYDSYIVEQNRVLFAGAFDSFDQIPSDLVRGTPGANQLAGNLFSFRVMDMVLFVLADFDETITDIVKSQEDGETAMTELLRLIVPELMSVLNAKYGQQYVLSSLETWLYNDLPQKLRRIYSGAWAIHSAKRSGVTSPGEDFEFYMFLKAEAAREGLELVDPGHPNMQQENVRRLKEYGMRLAERLCPPRPGASGLTPEMLSGQAIDELVAALQQAITARHGSINAFVNKIAGLVPRAFGTYLTGTVMPIYMLPETTYQYRLKLPGTVIQTNGVRELNGELVWNFADRDLAFTGQSMWARSIFVREPAVYSLGLKGFPASLADVDRVFSLLLTPTGAPRENLLKALRDTVSNRSFSPLEGIASTPNSPDAQSARGLLELFAQHRKRITEQEGAPEMPATAPPQTGLKPTPASPRQK